MRKSWGITVFQLEFTRLVTLGIMLCSCHMRLIVGMGKMPVLLTSLKCSSKYLYDNRVGYVRIKILGIDNITPYSLYLGVITLNDFG